MAFTPTAAQSAAIELKNKTMLVSAAAGSGKTATLTERILRRITDAENPCSITDLLVVTFTKASAADLLLKLSKKLTEQLAADPGNRHLTEQLLKLRSADVSTIHSFCMKVLRPNFQRLGLPADFRVGDEAEVRMLMQSEMRETLERFYEADPDTLDFPFLAVADCFSDVKNAELLSDSLLSLYDRLISYPESVSLLLRSAEAAESGKDFLHTPYGEVIRQHVRSFADYFLAVFDDAIRVFAADPNFTRAYLDRVTADRDFLLRLRGLTDDTYAAMAVCVSEYEPMRLGTVKAPDKTPESVFFLDQRDEFKKQLKDLQKHYFSATEEAIRSALAQNATLCHSLYRILSTFDGSFSAAKRALGICDYADLERYTYRLLLDGEGNPTELAREIGATYREIYVDEYQDTNEVQDAIFRAISNGNNRFMVGDIKQSIYRFRGANPGIFATYREKFPVYDGATVPDGDGVCLFMSENFRCDKTVIDFSNAVSRFMFAASPSVPFTVHDELKFSKGGPSGEQEVDLYLIDRAALTEEDDEIADGEAELIAREIRRMLDHETRPDGSRYTPADFAILCRSPNRIAEKFRRALDKYGIGANAETGEKFFENPEILLILSLLHAIDNPLRDPYFAGALCSPVFGFSMDELVRIRTEDPDAYSLYDAVCGYGGDPALTEKIADALTRLNRYREFARSETSERLIRFLYEDTGMLALLSDGERGVTVRRNLLRFYNYARTYESSSYKGLYRFLDYIASMQDEIIQSAQTGGGSAVTVTSIHKSKGMEFPVCFLADTARRFNAEIAKSAVVYDDKLGFTAKLRAPGGIARVDTLLRQCALRSITLEDRREEMRVLYVAMTRAKEKLIVTASLQNAEKLTAKIMAEAPYANEFWFCRTTRLIEWILGAVGKEQPSKVRFFYADANGTLIDRSAPVPEPVGEETGTETVEEISAEPREEGLSPEAQALRAELLERFSFTYPYEHLASLPAKLTVSRLHPAILDESTAEETVAFPEEAAADSLTAYEDLLSPPSFLSDTKEASGADKGTATHIFMQFCDLAALAEGGAKAELERLVREKFLPRETAELVRLSHIEKFRRSPLMREMLAAKNLRREFRFNVLLPAEAFTADAARRALMKNENLLVQGVIDCLLFYEDGSATLIDYKTDYLTAEELADPALAAKKLRTRHEKQLTYYALACRRMLNAPVRRVLIYSLPLGDTVEVKLE